MTKYASTILQNRSFKGLDLTGIDFSNSDLQGCDFTGATLVGANFAGVKTGQSRSQINKLIAATILAPAIIISLSILAVQIPVLIFGDRIYQGLNILLPGLPLLLFFLQMLFPNNATLYLPRTASLMIVISVAFLFQIMIFLTIFSGFSSIANFGDGSGAQGLLLLVITGIFALITHWIFQGLMQLIKSSNGTLFKKANLTDANLSQAVIQNTDFSFAVLTGICIFEWTVQRHTQFSRVYCDYLYLEPAQQTRHPAENKFQQGEVEDYLMGTQKQSLNNGREG